MAGAIPPRGGGGNTGKEARKRRQRRPSGRMHGASGKKEPSKRPRGRPRAQPPPPAAPFPLDLLLPQRAKPPSRATGTGDRRDAGEGAEPAFGAATSPEVLGLPNPDWLRHTLEVSGPADDLVEFRAAAAGVGAIPWRVPVAELEEGWFNLAVAVPDRHGSDGGVSVAGARVLAGQLAEAVRARADALALLDWAGEGRRSSYPLDLHALVPVPAEVLALGPDDPKALLWLWEHWGTTWPLRGVVEERAPARERQGPPAGHNAVRFAFHSADWSPWRALERLRARWPALAFTLRPDYGDAAADEPTVAAKPARKRRRADAGNA